MILKYHNAIMTKGKGMVETKANEENFMRHVLVLDQEPDICDFAKKLLKEYYKVSAFAFSTITCSNIVKNEPDILLLAADLEGLDSFELLAELKNTPEGKVLPVIMLTKQDDHEAERKAIYSGAADFISKPIMEETLLNRIALQLELKKYRLEGSDAEKYQDAISLSFAELVECRDETTGGHLKNTTIYFNILLEEALKHKKYKDIIPKEDIKDLLRSAPLHDIGKIGINDEILRKSSPLDYTEFEHMKTHTTLGKEAFEKIIQETGGSRWLYLARDIAYCHHERWDGTGYPNGLKGENIPLYARMLSVADVYDALTSMRTYKDAYSHQQAMKIITNGKGTLFDPDLVDLFVEVNERFHEVLLLKNTKE